jgi:hypothetical protein
MCEGALCERIDLVLLTDINHVESPGVECDSRDISWKKLRKIGLMVVISAGNAVEVGMASRILEAKPRGMCLG